ncbi:MAG: RepB family plasmid replication initiator protein, partial [Massilia sp.]
QYKDIGTRTLNLAWLREALQMEPDEYKLTANFINRIIEPSVEQINKHSDLTVSYKPKKTGRAITDFAFKIKNKDAKSKRQNLTDQEIREQLEFMGQQRIDDPSEEF